MDRLTRVYKLHQILKSRRRPVPLQVLREELECSRASVIRIIRDLRLFFRAPLEYDRQANGYCYTQAEGHSFELPGLWFSAAELHSLLAAHKLLTEAQPGLLDGLLAPLAKRIDDILSSVHLGGGEVARRIRILPMAERAPLDAHFQTVAGAVLQRRRIRIRYYNRSRDERSEREVSPQRLIHYRDNWYLDAWCHMAGALRSFALDAIEAASALDAKAQDEPDAKLDAHFTASYGIFAGAPKATAVLRFTTERARWVARERWHPKQTARFLDDGRYELRIPYSDPRELVMDILKYGVEVEVVSPVDLRRLVAEKLTKAATQYRG